MPVSIRVALKASRSTIAAQSRGPVKVLDQPVNASLVAIAMPFFSTAEPLRADRQAAKMGWEPGVDVEFERSAACQAPHDLT